MMNPGRPKSLGAWRKGAEHKHQLNVNAILDQQKTEFDILF